MDSTSLFLVSGHFTHFDAVSWLDYKGQVTSKSNVAGLLA